MIDGISWCSGVADHKRTALVTAAIPQKNKKTFLFKFSLTFIIVLDIIEYVMIATTHHQSWLFFLPLAQQAALLKDDLLDPVDHLLEDPELVELVRHCLARRYPASTRTGRIGMAPDRLL